MAAGKKNTFKKSPPQIIAVNENAAMPHYYPQEKNSKIIKKNNLILVDLWARLKKNNSPFADITWIAYSGKNIPKEIKIIFNKVIKARNLAIKFIRENLKKKKFPRTRTIDKIVRNYFKRFDLDKYFIHSKVIVWDSIIVMVNTSG